MKVGILTVPFNNNYGGFLQAFALKTFLNNLNCETVFFNRQRDKHKHSLLKLIVGWPMFLFRDYRNRKMIKKISVYTDVFKKRYLEPISEAYYSTEELKKCLLLNCDAYIVGSDQVWRYRYAKKSVEDYFFNFLQGTTLPRFSYAASFGVSENEYPPECLTYCSELLSQFKAISVRESSGKEMLQKYFSINPDDVKIVADPTFLLEKKDYEKLFNQQHSTEDTLFTYVLDSSKEKSDAVEIIASSKKLNVIQFFAQDCNSSNNRVVEPVEKWLQKLAQSSFVMTDSFHGMVFSIIFNKPFIVYGNKNRGSTRFFSLLQMLHLESRYIEDKSGIQQILEHDVIDWKSVNSIVSKCRQESAAFIQENLFR